MNAAVDPKSQSLTRDQITAVVTRDPEVFLNSEPGSGKTTVATQRFGFHRFSPTHGRARAADLRAVMAVSFTRSATWELTQRVRQVWGRSALEWPNRITTIDGLLRELLEHLLDAELLMWPGEHRRVEVHDTWKVVVDLEWGRRSAELVIEGDRVEIASGFEDESAHRVPVDRFTELIGSGVCTHDEVRAVLTQALESEEIAKASREHLGRSLRALIVDEVFDANGLDLRIVELAAEGGVAVTLIGDPWQALYAWRGAEPEEVPALVERRAMVELPLRASFRWKTDGQRKLAEDLRAGLGVELLDAVAESANVDVVIATTWKPLWDLGPAVLPLAFSSAKGTPAEAAANLVLHQVVRTVLAEDAIYASDAWTTLGIDDEAARARVISGLVDVVDALRRADPTKLNPIYDRLVDLIAAECDADFKRAHWQYTRPLKMIQLRLLYEGQLVMGLSAHQAKGREWERVGVHLVDGERETLHNGLLQAREGHRKLYVACTRARAQTCCVQPLA